jgi:hypothetical protein
LLLLAQLQIYNPQTCKNGPAAEDTSRRPLDGHRSGLAAATAGGGLQLRAGRAIQRWQALPPDGRRQRAQQRLQRRKRIVLLGDAVTVALAAPAAAALHKYMAKHAAAPVESNSPSGYHLQRA